MLILQRNVGERIVITTVSGERIVVTLVGIRDMRRARIGLEADRSIKIHRGEVQDQIEGSDHV